MPRNTKKSKSTESKRVTKKKQPIEELIRMEPMEVSNTNLLVDAAINRLLMPSDTENQIDEQDKQTKRCPKGHRRNKSTG